MRLLIITTMSVFPWGGSEELWLRTANAALDAGHEVTVMGFRWPKRSRHFDELEARGAKILARRVPASGRLDRTLYRFTDPFKPLKNLQPDVIYINQGGTYDIATMSEGARLREYVAASGKPYLVVCQALGNLDTPTEAHQPILREFFAKAAEVGFVAAQMIDTAQRQLATAIPNATVIRNPVNLKNLDAVPWPANNTPTFASVARLEPRKGLDLAFAALASPAWSERAYQFKIYGDGPFAQYYRKLAEYYRLTKKVVFCGQVSDIRSVWQDAHALILTSHAEGTPLATVEALICGRPVVTTDVGGALEWVDETSGVVAEGTTVTSVSQALERFWSRRHEWQAMGASGRSRALKQIDHDPGRTMLAKLIRLARG